uniref:Hypothetical chloroplast RF20 n=1 Tax=Microthamnion kuetzingianum TaxID=34148 RepID=A0A097KNI1_9CHLO|nr:hypothetical chloroplast RF20 [Microthamnion kuetzingianum]AIT94733.1 hypothetical chloroplast RF20 [Microthamnion kuetzingianum]
MTQKIRFAKFIKRFFFETKNKYLFFKKYFSLGIFFLFLGFLLGNIFGTFLNLFRNYLIWDGLIVFFLIFFCEIVNYNIYTKKKKLSHIFTWSLKFPGAILWKFLNYFKIGVLFGFFIDAFKVGS